MEGGRHVTTLKTNSHDGLMFDINTIHIEIRNLTTSSTNLSVWPENIITGPFCVFIFALMTVIALQFEKNDTI